MNGGDRWTDGPWTLHHTSPHFTTLHHIRPDQTRPDQISPHYTRRDAHALFDKGRVVVLDVVEHADSEGRHRLDSEGAGVS